MDLRHPRGWLRGDHVLPAGLPALLLDHDRCVCGLEHFPACSPSIPSLSPCTASQGATSNLRGAAHAKLGGAAHAKLCVRGCLRLGACVHVRVSSGSLHSRAEGTLQRLCAGHEPGVAHGISIVQLFSCILCMRNPTCTHKFCSPHFFLLSKIVGMLLDAHLCP